MALILRIHVATNVQWNHSNPDTLGTISGVHVLYGGVLISGVSYHANAAFGTTIRLARHNCSCIACVSGTCLLITHIPHNPALEFIAMASIKG